MPDETAAQEEFNRFTSRNSGPTSHAGKIHPEDWAAASRDAHGEGEHEREDIDEEDRHRTSQIDAAMRMPTLGNAVAGGADFTLPPPSFDSGHATGVKGVIADARDYEIARRNKLISSVKHARRSASGVEHKPSAHITRSGSANARSDSAGESVGDDEEYFLQKWRESRRRELEGEARSGMARTRRTSPSLRTFGRFDQVDALGYLDAIEKVGRDTVVAVFVYDHECEVSAAVESALRPLVATHPAIHFVKVHYDDIEFDNAAVPAILAYRNQGDLFANLTGIIELIPDNEDFTSDSLRRLFEKHGIL